MSKAIQNVSMMDIARRLNISQATVSYVLNGRSSGLVSERTRERVLEAAQQMGYRRNRAAQALAGHGSRVIELCVYGYFPAFFAQIIESFNQALIPDSYELHIANLDPMRGREENWSPSNGEWPVDGIVSHTPISDTMLFSLKQRGIPSVSVGPYANREMDHVLVDLAPALFQGISHIVEQCRRVAFVSMWSASIATTNHEADPRYWAYHQVMQEFGLPEELILVHEIPGTTLRALTHKIMRDYITEHGCPDAFFCFNDERAIGTLAALRDLGIRVPHDVLLLGCDGIEETQYHSPPISTIQYPFEEVARLSWQFLQHRMKHPDAPLQSTTLTAQLLLRESSHK